MEQDVEKLLLRSATEMDALEQLYYLLKKDVFALAMATLRSLPLAEDGLQETFVRIPGAVRGYKAGKSGGKEFVLGITANVCREILRKSRRDIPTEDNGYEPDAPDVDFGQSLTVRAALTLLRPMQRQVFTLRVFSDMTFEQIACILQIPASNVKYHYAKAVDTLRAKREVFL